jgi:hypothetical protein
MEDVPSILRAALERGRLVRIEYRAVAGTGVSRHDLAIRRLAADHVEADCRNCGDARAFEIARIRTARIEEPEVRCACRTQPLGLEVDQSCPRCGVVEDHFECVRAEARCVNLGCGELLGRSEAAEVVAPRDPVVVRVPGFKPVWALPFSRSGPASECLSPRPANVALAYLGIVGAPLLMVSPFWPSPAPWFLPALCALPISLGLVGVIRTGG